jgi:hypothetical protein
LRLKEQVDHRIKKMTNFTKTNRQIWLFLTILSIIFICFSCAHNGDWAKRLDWKEFEFTNLPGEKDYPDAAAIIILDEGKMQIIGASELPTSVFERHRIVKILNSRGQRYANIAIPYTSQSQVENIRARTISPKGEIKVLNKGNIYDVNLYPRFIFYSDQRAKLFTMPAIEDGSIVEYRYRLRISGRSLWPSWSFQDNVPTLKSRFMLVAPSEWDVNYKHYNVDLEVVVSEAPKGFRSTYTWEIANVPALKSEFGMPSLKECVARLDIAPLGMNSWDDVALWYHELAEPGIKAGKNVKELALTLTEGVESNEDKLRIIYEWVRDQVRYIAVEIGIGGYQPHPAEQVLVNRYGDCKDVSTLLCSLSREVGIEAYEVLVSTWQNGEPDTSLPSPFQFNHAIAYCPSIGDSGLWLDATEKGCPFGDLPWYDQGLPVLVVGKDGEAEVITTPHLHADNNHKLFEWQVELEETGVATVMGSTQFSGALATEMREALFYASRDDRRQWLETYLATRCSGAKLDSFHISGLHPVSDPLTICYKFHTNSFAVPDAGEMDFRPGQILAFDLPDYFRSPDRDHPIQFRFGVHNELKLTINLPDKWVANTPAWSDSIVSPFGSAFWSYSTNCSTLYVHSSCLLNGGSVDPKQYQDFQNFLDTIKQKDLREVVLTKRSI